MDVRVIQVCNPIPALRMLEIDENDTRLTLSGRVSIYYMKQLAQEAGMPLLRQRELLKLVCVDSPPDG